MTDEELKNASEEYCPDDAYPFGPMAINLEVRKAFIAGAEWRDAQIPKLPNDVEKAAENYIAPIENDEGLDYINFNGRDIKDAFLAGAEWQRNKMLEDAVEGTVHHYESVHWIITNQDQLAARLKQFEQDTKVRIIIIPNTDEK